MSTDEENVDDEDFMKEDSDHAAKVLQSVLFEVSTMNPLSPIRFRHVRSKYQHSQPGIQLLSMDSSGGY